MTAKRAWRGRTSRHDDSEHAAPPEPLFGWRPRPRLAERACYWLLYLVALPAACLHWRAGNEELALLCALAVVASLTFITAPHRKR